MGVADTDLAAAVRLLRESKSIVALTGAGVSTESGIPDFRSHGGLWSRFDPVEYGTLGAFRRDPVKVWSMLSELLDLVDAQPNKGHEAMSRLEQLGHLTGIITQNIDGLHQKAGSRVVVEFHGSLATFSCPGCGSQYFLEQVLAMQLPPECGCGAILKPDIVFFDETISSHALTETDKLVSAADLLIVAGTSCQVTPASSIPSLVRQRGGRIIEINLEPALEMIADIVLQGSFGRTMSGLVAAFARSI